MGLLSTTACDFAEQLEKRALLVGVDGPVDGRGLVAVEVIVFAGIEVAPGCVLIDGRVPALPASL